MELSSLRNARSGNRIMGIHIPFYERNLLKMPEQDTGDNEASDATANDNSMFFL